MKMIKTSLFALLTLANTIGLSAQSTIVYTQIPSAHIRANASSELPKASAMEAVNGEGMKGDNKIFKAEYGITPSGAFVPLAEERITISGTVEKTYEVEPLLRIELVGEPVVNADRTVSFTVKVTYGTDNTTYKKPLAEGWLYVSETDYVGDFSYSPNYSVKLTPAQMGVGAADILGANGTTFTVSTAQASKAFPDYSRKYFFRFGARTDIMFDATKRYNYTEVREVTIPAK